MKLKQIFAILIIATVSICVFAAEEEPSEPSYEGYELVWADEFDTDGMPDSNNWTYERGFVRNEELQWYQPENARCEGGLLIIEGRREKIKNPNYTSYSTNWKQNREYAEYTSSSLTTRDIHSWQYGRFVMKAKIDTRPGLWPAFWTLGVEGSWPHCGEIDIMEYYKGLLLANAAWGSKQRWKPIWDDFRKPISEFNDPNWSDKFHVWRMDWDQQSIELYVDNILLNIVNLSETFNEDSDGKNPFRQPHYIILNLAIGGTAGGDPSETQFPAKYEIDYVRIYKEQ